MLFMKSEIALTQITKFEEIMPLIYSWIPKEGIICLSNRGWLYQINYINLRLIAL